MRRLAAHELGPERGPRLVMVHGFTQTGRSWLPTAEALATDGWRVVLVDAPGHGDSPDVPASLWEAADRLGAAGDAAVYLGYSMGGRLALHLALARPTLVRGLILLGATAGLDSPDARAARRASDEALAADLERDGLDVFLDRWLASPMFAGLAADQRGLDDRRRNTVAGLAASLRRAGTGAQDPLWDRLGALTMPVLVMAGERDTTFVALAQRFAVAVGANAHHLVVPGAGHAAHLERPEATLALLRAFLDPFVDPPRVPPDVGRRR